MNIYISLLLSCYYIVYCIFSEDKQRTSYADHDKSEDEEILGSDDDEQEDPHDYVKGKRDCSDTWI